MRNRSWLVSWTVVALLVLAHSVGCGGRRGGSRGRDCDERERDCGDDGTDGDSDGDGNVEVWDPLEGSGPCENLVLEPNLFAAGSLTGTLYSDEGLSVPLSGLVTFSIEESTYEYSIGSGSLEVTDQYGAGLFECYDGTGTVGCLGTLSVTLCDGAATLSAGLDEDGVTHGGAWSWSDPSGLSWASGTFSAASD